MSDETQWDDIRKLLQDLGVAVDAQRLQVLQAIFDPKFPETLTVLPTKRQVAHLNFMQGLGKTIGGEIGKFVEELRMGEILHWRSIKGVGLEKFTNAIENQNAADVTVRNETISQQLTEKHGIWDRLRGKPSE